MKRAVLWLGREPSYVRHDVVIQGLKENGVETVICSDSSKNMLVRFLKTIPQYWKAVQQPHDFVWVGFYAHPLVWWAKQFTKKPVLFDVWLSSYETMVSARKELVFFAPFFKWLDRFAIKNCDAAIFPALGELNYFKEKLGIEGKRMEVIPVGANTKKFFPKPVAKNEKFVVLFVGTFLQITSVETIVRAANELRKEKGIEFWIAGNGPTFDHDTALAKELGLTNARFLGKVAYAIVPDLLNQCDASLGIFGVGEKANRILPSKVNESMAMKKPTVTGYSEGVLELLKDGESVLLCEPLNEKDLAKKILWLYRNPKRAKKIGESAYAVFDREALPKKIGKKILSIVESIEREKD